jgi:hypothetical protein
MATANTELARYANLYGTAYFGKILAIIPETVIASTEGTTRTISSTDYGSNFEVTILCTTGALFINPSTIATSTNGFKLEELKSMDLAVRTNLSLIGNTTTAAYEAIVWRTI